MTTIPRRDWTPPSRRRVLALRDRLRLVYGRPAAPPHRQPLDELILTVLSQSTNDRNRDVAFLRLRARFPSWSAVRDAPNEEVEEAIRPGGISKVKSQRIQAILRALDDPPSLDHLATMDVAAARDELCALPGVGRKTAACVLLFSFGMPDIPVDTHVSASARGSACSAPARRSRSCTTTCSRSPRAARSSSSTSTCSATAAAPATRSGPNCPEACCDVSPERTVPRWRCEANPITTYLELTDPAGSGPRAAAPRSCKVDPPDGAVNRRFYEEIGARLRMDRPPRAARTPGGRPTRATSRPG